MIIDYTSSRILCAIDKKLDELEKIKKDFISEVINLVIVYSNELTMWEHFKSLFGCKIVKNVAWIKNLEKEMNEGNIRNNEKYHTRCGYWLHVVDIDRDFKIGEFRDVCDEIKRLTNRRKVVAGVDFPTIKLSVEEAIYLNMWR